MFFLAMAAFCLVNATSSFAQTVWAIDQSHTNIQFSVSHMVVSEVSGFFKKFDGKLLAANADFSNSTVEFSLETASINTDNEKRDAHLRSADFFDAEKFPAITFKSKSFTKVNDKKFKVVGDFTMHGITKSIELDVNYNGMMNDPWGNTKAGFKLSGSVNRIDYDVKWNKSLDAGGVMLGENVAINCNVELTRQK